MMLKVSILTLLFPRFLQVFSHDAYLCSLISRDDLNSPLVRPGEDCEREVCRHNRHWQFTNHFPLPANTEDSATHDVNQRQVLLHGAAVDVVVSLEALPRGGESKI